MSRVARTVVALVALAASSCAPPPQAPAERWGPTPQQSTPAAPQRVVLAITREPTAFYEHLNPSAGGASTNSILDFMHPGLTVTDNAGVYHAALGEAVPTVENGLWKVLPDGTMETTHPIRAGATINGVAATATVPRRTARSGAVQGTD